MSSSHFLPTDQPQHEVVQLEKKSSFSKIVKTEIPGNKIQIPHTAILNILLVIFV